MPTKIRRATHAGEMKIGDLAIPCAVLEDGTRLLSKSGVIGALGFRRGGAHSYRKKFDDNLPVFISAKNILPHIDVDLKESLKNPILYLGPKSGTVAHGVEATLIPRICEVWLRAREAGDILSSQLHIAAKAEILVRGLAHVGIVGLVDEATGYQKVRARRALEQILEKYISDKLLAWAKRFPDEFYREIFRLKGWSYSQLVAGQKPPIIGKYTNDIVYARLAPYILDELQARNPPTPKGYRKHKHHQWLSEDVGHPALRDHLMGVIALMKASSNWATFKRALDRVYPKLNEQVQLELWFDEVI